jgi:CheY-like chemotaxis protein
MARIWIQLDDPAAAAGTGRILEAEGHQVVIGQDSGEEPLDQAQRAVRLLESKPDVAVVGYQAEDALSVKVMQETRTRDPYLKFIFVLSGPVEPEHLVMAVNEGAAAFLTAALSSGALLNFVARAEAKKKREMDRDAEVDRCRDIIEKEKVCSLEQASQIARNRRLLQASQRLINHLLAASIPRNPRVVLLVSDSTFQLDLFRKSLEDHNFRVVTAANGSKGLEAAREHHPRIIVSDLEMPGLSGLELCRAVKNDETLSPNHFIVFTANERRMDEILRPENKVDDCLIKPSRSEDYQAFVARVALGIMV